MKNFIRSYTSCTAMDVCYLLQAYLKPQLPSHMTIGYITFRVIKPPIMWKWLVKFALWILKKDGMTIIDVENGEMV